MTQTLNEDSESKDDGNLFQRSLVEFDQQIIDSDNKNQGIFLYVCQEDEKYRKYNQLSLFDNSRKLYPYNPKKNFPSLRDGLTDALITEPSESLK